MAGVRKIAASYAGAFFDLAVERNLASEVHEDMQLIASVLKENPELRQILASPVISGVKKNSILDAIFHSRVQELTIRFLHLMVKALRIVYLKEIAQQTLMLYKEYKGIRTVSLRTAVPLTEKQRNEFSGRLIELLKADIDLQEITDPSIIGGFVVQVDDERFDASFRMKLNRLDRQFDINIYKKGF